MAGESTSFVHRPVMVREVVEVFRSAPPGAFVDCTIGGGGHTRVLLEAYRDREVVGLDRDDAAIAASTEQLAELSDRVRLRRARFDRLAEIVADEHARPVAGVLFDLGVSSPQLDVAERGFSYRHDGPLDMRMDRSGARTAADVVNTYDEHTLTEVLRRYGDERFAQRIARGVVAARPITTTAELATVVRDAIPAPARRRGGHPATRTFQAIRIEVNDELAVLRRALDQALDVLAPDGICAVLSYHSGEDRIVKDRFRTELTGGCTCPPRLPCVCGASPRARQVVRGARKASSEEVAANPRAASARLRAIAVLPNGGPR